jgi:hypothetical protein
MLQLMCCLSCMFHCAAGVVRLASLSDGIVTLRMRCGQWSRTQLNSIDQAKDSVR